MADYEIGYGKPPKNGQFKPGVSGNPRGRPKRSPGMFEIVDEVLKAPMRRRGQKKGAKLPSREEVSLQLLAERAMKGDVASADLLLKARTLAARRVDEHAEPLEIIDWLPDYPGQTGDEKTRAHSVARSADPADAPGPFLQPAPQPKKE